MSVSNIPDSVKLRLWGKAAGRCEYRGCRAPLWLDSLTKAEFNTAYIAHIYGDSPGGPRYEAGTSELLATDISNLMLMCDEHHRLIDKGAVAEHPVARLIEMKTEHEARIELLGGLGPELESEVVMYGANVGEHGATITMEQATEAMTPMRYPASKRGIPLGLKHSLAANRDAGFWNQERSQLTTAFHRLVRPLLADGGTHLSVFGLAPQPLLIQLGSLLCDIHDVDVYQLHREPRQTWRWDEGAGDPFEIAITPELSAGTRVAAVFELSYHIDHQRVRAVLSDDVAIWSMKLSNPGNDRLRTRKQLQHFRAMCRQIFSDINQKHPGLKQLEVFPILPVAAAVELGRVHMPKADPPLFIWDEQRDSGGFTPTFLIS
jgi:hypothetical protein